MASDSNERHLTQLEHSERHSLEKCPPAWVLFAPCATVFISSACVMMIELLAFRLITRFVGQSNYTVSAIIGVVLGGLAIGNYAGGRLADRFRARPTLSVLFMLSSAACLSIPALNNLFGEWPALWHFSLPARIAVHVSLTFALPSALLGTMGPVLAKSALDQGRQVGRTVGSVYAWGVVGSLVGTFLCGFWLIPNFELYTVNYSICGVLALMGILFGVRRWWPYAGSAVVAILTVLALGPWSWSRSWAAEWGMRDREGPEILFDKSSEYSQVRVERDPSEPGRRVMMLDKLAHSFYNPDRPNDLLYGYELVFDAVTDHATQGRDDLNALIFGGGGYTHPRHLLLHRPRSRLQVVEIDPVVTEAAIAAFGFEPDPRVEIIHLDARQHVNALLQRKRDGEVVPEFDFVYLDAINDFNVPYHLTVVEFQKSVKELLMPGGVFLMNVVDILDVGNYLGAQIHTTRQVFDHVDCFFANEAEPGQGLVAGDRNTFVIVASDRDLHLDQMGGTPTMNETRMHLLPNETIADLLARVDPIVLNDNYAPVEFLMIDVVQRWWRTTEPLRYLNRGNRLHTAGRLDDAAEYFLRALEIEPDLYLALLNLGCLRVDQGRLDAAAARFREAAKARPDAASPLLNLSSVNLLRGDNDSAVKTLGQLVQIHPDHAGAHYQLGLALGRLGKLEESGAEFRRTLELDPDFPDAARFLTEVEAAIANQG